MNEYKNHQEKTTVANEAWVAYNAHLTDAGKMSVLGSALMFLDTNQPKKQVRIASLRVIKKIFTSLIFPYWILLSSLQNHAFKKVNAIERLQSLYQSTLIFGIKFIYLQVS